VTFQFIKDTLASFFDVMHSSAYCINWNHAQFFHHRLEYRKSA